MFVSPIDSHEDHIHHYSIKWTTELCEYDCLRCFPIKCPCDSYENHIPHYSIKWAIGMLCTKVLGCFLFVSRFSSHKNHIPHYSIKWIIKFCEQNHYECFLIVSPPETRKIIFVINQLNQPWNCVNKTTCGSFYHESLWLSRKSYSSLFNKINNRIVLIKLPRVLFDHESPWLWRKSYSSLFNKINNKIMWTRLIGVFFLYSAHLNPMKIRFFITQ